MAGFSHKVPESFSWLVLYTVRKLYISTSAEETVLSDREFALLFARAIAGDAGVKVAGLSRTLHAMENAIDGVLSIGPVS